jgi:hypothetical protein
MRTGTVTEFPDLDAPFALIPLCLAAWIAAGCLTEEEQECGLVALGDVKSSEPPGWDYDDEECEWLCPDHAPKCPTCGRSNGDELSINCSNSWHLTWEDQLPEQTGTNRNAS